MLQLLLLNQEVDRVLHHALLWCQARLHGAHLLHLLSVISRYGCANGLRLGGNLLVDLSFVEEVHVVSRD